MPDMSTREEQTRRDSDVQARDNPPADPGSHSPGTTQVERPADSPAGAVTPGQTPVSAQDGTSPEKSQHHTSHHGNEDAVTTATGGPGANQYDTETSVQDRPSEDPRKETDMQQNNLSGNKSVISVEVKKSTSDMQINKTPLDSVGPSDSASNIRKPNPKEPSFIQTVKNEAKILEKTMGGRTVGLGQNRTRKKMRKSIFISYSPDAGFLERKFVLETIKQLKENSLSEDIWFDKDEHNIDSPCWFSLRMEAVERCRAAILFLSDSYFSCPVSVYEGKALLERQKLDPSSVSVFLVLYSLSPDTEVPVPYRPLLQEVVDLTSSANTRKSLAEKTSVVVGALMMDLEQHASILAPTVPVTPFNTEFTGAFRKLKLCSWTPADLQEWLFNLGVKEFYRQSLAEQQVDGFLLLALTDLDMSAHLAIDSRVVRKKIMQQILVTLDKEHKAADNWHLRARTQRPKPNSVYLIYDPTDVRLAQNLKQDLSKKGLTVIHHHKLGQSKEEFLQLNGPQMALATFTLVLMTEGAIASPFVFHEVLFADWLGKKLVTAMFKNTWYSLRPALKAILGDCPAIDFETRLYTESMDILEHHIKPLRSVPGVVLEQTYLNKMADGIKPFSLIASLRGPKEVSQPVGDSDAQVFISYQWDMQARVEEIRRYLGAAGLTCWADISPTMVRGNSSVSMRSYASSVEVGNETLSGQIQRTMRAASLVLSCITPKYMQSDNCMKDLALAEATQKPIVPVLLRFSPWPPEGTQPYVRKILVKLAPIDLSNEKLFKQNLPMLLEKIKRLIPVK